MPKRKKVSYEQRVSNKRKKRKEERCQSVETCNKENVQEETEDESEGKHSAPRENKLERDRKRYQKENVRERKLTAMRDRLLNPLAKERDRKHQRDRYQETEVHEKKLSAARKRRLNPVVKEKERQQQRDHYQETGVREKKLSALRKAFAAAASVFEENIQDGPMHICACCDRLFFKTSIKTTNHQKLKDKGCTEAFITSVILDQFLQLSEDENFLLCSTCYKDITGKKKKAPKFSIKGSNLQFPDRPDVVANMSPLAERLVSPRIPFMKIHTLGCDRQKGLKGAVVLVPCSVEKNVEMIPMLPKDTETIVIKLKRMMAHKHHFLFERINPQQVIEAAKWLVKQELFIKHKITLDGFWEKLNITNFSADEEVRIPEVSCLNMF